MCTNFHSSAPQMADISIELGHWKEKATVLQRRVESFDRDAMHMRTLNAELGESERAHIEVVVRYAGCECVFDRHAIQMRTLDAKRYVSV